MEQQDKFPIQLYSGDRKSIDMKFSEITDVYGTTLIIYEWEEISYQELLQFVTKESLRGNQYDFDGKPVCFLWWHDGYLFDFGKPTWINNENDQWLSISYFFYCHMDKYEESKTIEVFGDRTKMCITKTDRPLLVKIINHIKELEAKALSTKSQDSNQESKN